MRGLRSVLSARPLSAARPLAVTLGSLAGYAVVRHWLIPDRLHFVANVAATGVVIVGAAAFDLTSHELGTSRDRLRAGLRGGLAAAAVIVVAMIGAALLPAGRELFDDDRVDVGIGPMLVRVLVTIPIGTVLFEELAFRGVVLALLLRDHPRRASAVWSAVCFSLWHLPPIIGDGAGEIASVLVATFAAGIVFAWLRLHTGSLMAPAFAHVATNSGAFALAWFVA